MSEPKDWKKAEAPVVEAEFAFGLNVVDIGDLRVARGMTRRPFSMCSHQRLVYDLKERRVWCKDCETEVEAFDAFVSIAERADHIEKRIAKLREDASATILSRAAKVLDDVFRSRTRIPCCPHCKAGIMPEDVANGVAQMSKDMEKRRRLAKGK